MAGTKTLSEIIERVRSRAGMTNSKFKTDPEIQDLINDSIASLYDLLVQHRGEEFFEEKTTVQLVKGQAAYDLPSDFYKLVSVQFESGVPLKKFNRREPYHKALELRYRITNNQLQLNREDFSDKLPLYYIPLAPELVEDGDTTDFYNGWERYVILDCAISLLGEEESDTSQLEREFMRVTNRIEASAPKDEAGPSRVADVERIPGHGFREIY